MSFIRIVSPVILRLTFGSVDLVAADGHQIDLHVRDVDGNLPDGLSGVSVEEDSFRATNLTCGQEGGKDAPIRTLNQIRDGRGHGGRGFIDPVNVMFCLLTPH